MVPPSRSGSVECRGESLLGVGSWVGRGLLPCVLPVYVKAQGLVMMEGWVSHMRSCGGCWGAGSAGVGGFARGAGDWSEEIR